MKLKNKKLILFDLDGTLIDSVPDLANAVNHTLTTIGKEPFSEDEIREWVGNGSATLTKRALSGSADIDPNLDEEYFKKAHKILLEFYGNNVCIETKLYDGVKETLTDLKNKGFKLTIITNKPFAFIDPILKNLQLDELFEKSIGADSLEKKKPDPLPLTYMCEEMNCHIEHAVMIGDSKNDILAAKAAGIDSIGVTYGYNYGDNISIYEPDLIVEHFSHISDILGEA
ncbi:MAG: phosphoglycolate phosphatase [Campylobacterota bacterium]|nr:phosphoglycolate phosphatase [Campylobacterota bacterium]